jgi:hypothetical protein
LQVETKTEEKNPLVSSLFVLAGKRAIERGQAASAEIFEVNLDGSF